MNDKQITEAFGRIKAKDAKKEQAYHEILRKSQDKNFISKKKFTLRKHVFDRYVPLVAVGCVMILCFSFFAVSGGWFTGESFRSTAEIYSEAGVTAAPTSIDPYWGNEVTVSGNGDQANAEEEATTENAEEGTPAADSGTGRTPETVDMSAILPMDVGFTEYIISAVPKDASALWSELLRINAVPNSIELLSYSLENGVLTLNFNEFLQNAVTSAGNSFWMQGIGKTFSSLYPEAEEIVILSGGNNVQLNNRDIDTAALISEDVAVTDTKTLTYGEDAA